MVTIPLSVYTGTEATRVVRKEYLVEGTDLIPVGRSAIRQDTGDVIASDMVVRMAQADSGAWVALSDDEIAACTSDRGLAEVVSFVKNTKVGGYLVEDYKIVTPKREKGKINPAVDRAFSLLCMAMKDAKVHALIKVAMRGPARYALLDCEGNLYLIHSADQVRGNLGGPTEYAFTDQERSLAQDLIEAVGVDVPVLTDTTAPAVKEYVNAKADGVTPQVAAAPAPTGIDIMSQLQASIAAAKGGKGKVKA
jgi:non-homologous end joining protein Ku